MNAISLGVSVLFKTQHYCFCLNLKFARVLRSYSFCLNCSENVFQLFWSCPFPTSVWIDICSCILSFIEQDCVLHFENVLLGFTGFSFDQR